MKATRLLAAFAAVAWIATSAAAGEEKLWEESGETGHGTIEVRRGPGVPLKDLNEIDAATVEQVRRRWERLMAGEPRVAPPLKYTVDVEKSGLAPLPPESVLGGLTRAPDDFVLVRNTHASAAAPAGFSPIVNEPSVAAVGDLVLFTGNWYAALSTDGGDTFSFVNPFEGPFAPAGSGFCCDQVTVYSPAVDTLFYLQQFGATKASGTQRINVDTGADGTFDCFYDVTPPAMGMGAATWADFPDLAVSDNYLYHSTNVFSTFNSAFIGAFTARYPLAGLSSCQANVSFDVYRDFGGFFSFRLTRGATTTMYFADHISNASLRIWRWPEADAGPTSFDRAVTAWTEAQRVCPGPDGRDWCGRIDRRLMGAWVGDGTVGFMWTPAQGAGFPFPYTRVARFSEAGLALVGEPLIWSGSHAWVYPSVAVNAAGDLGGTILAGGGASLYTSCIAWIADDVNGDAIAPLESQAAFFGTIGPSSNLSGDYTSARPYWPNAYLWAGACFGYTSTTVGHARYVLFGREADVARIFTDGFESGNTNAWSAVVP